MQQLNLSGLPEIEPKVRLMRRIGAGKWVTLIRRKESELDGLSFTDLDGDGLFEVALVLKQIDSVRIFVGKFVSKQWWLGKQKLPNNFSPFRPVGTIFHYGESKWTLWQDKNNRCIAVTVKR